VTGSTALSLRAGDGLVESEAAVDMRSSELIVSTTAELEGHAVVAYLGIASGEAVMSVSPVAGRAARRSRTLRRSGPSFEERVCETRDRAITEMVQLARGLGATAIIAVDIDYTTVRRARGGDLLVITASGTVVTTDG
jgi:uncharacterized protein YbjQ (UPF0145 family)